MDNITKKNKQAYKIKKHDSTFIFMKWHREEAPANYKDLAPQKMKQLSLR